MATRVTKHASPLLLRRGVRGEAGQPMEIVLHLPTAPALSVSGFEFDSAFPGASLIAAVPELVHAAHAAHEARLMAFGHADEAGSEAHNKKLADRRAKALQALLTQDLSAFDDLAKADDWKLIHYQVMLKNLGMGAAVDGTDGPPLSNAVKGFQRHYNERVYHERAARTRAHEELEVDGDLGPLTKAAMRDAYLAQAGTGLPKERFFGPQFAGCGEFNRIGSPEKDRRAVLVLYRPDFPTESKIPCREGDAGACALNKKAPHPWKCNFYRRTIEREEPVDVNRDLDLARDLEFALRYDIDDDTEMDRSGAVVLFRHETGEELQRLKLGDPSVTDDLSRGVRSYRFAKVAAGTYDIALAWGEMRMWMALGLDHGLKESRLGQVALANSETLEATESVMLADNEPHEPSGGVCC